MAYERPRKWTWYLLPIFFGIFGGLIAYFILRRDSGSMARNCLYLGGALTAAQVGITLIMGGLA